ASPACGSASTTTSGIGGPDVGSGFSGAESAARYWLSSPCSASTEQRTPGKPGRAGPQRPRPRKEPAGHGTSSGLGLVPADCGNVISVCLEADLGLCRCRSAVAVWGNSWGKIDFGGFRRHELRMG